MADHTQLIDAEIVKAEARLQKIQQDIKKQASVVASKRGRSILSRRRAVALQTKTAKRIAASAAESVNKASAKMAELKEKRKAATLELTTAKAKAMVTKAENAATTRIATFSAALDKRTESDLNKAIAKFTKKWQKKRAVENVRKMKEMVKKMTAKVCMVEKRAQRKIAIAEKNSR